MTGFAAWLRVAGLVRKNGSLRAPIHHHSVAVKAAVPSRSNMASI
jgi:hypothetical protein